ncbi:MAG: nuclear transport factor 2 family protein, partial [Chloroflexi bacterium]|nr:nuclear transport factor 2 family protein [Chloroflexota bacterium]
MSSFSEEQALVASANQAFYSAIESLDVNRMRQVWLAGDEIECVHPGWPPIRGLADVLRSWELIFSNTREIRFELSDIQVVADGAVAWVSCLEGIYYGEQSAGQALATNLLRQNEAGRWLLIC